MIQKCLKHVKLPIYYIAKNKFHSSRNHQKTSNKIGSQKNTLKKVVLTSGFLGLVATLFADKAVKNDEETPKETVENKEHIENKDNVQNVTTEIIENTNKHIIEPIKTISNEIDLRSSRQKNNFIVDVSNKCSPSVVFIEIKDPRRILPETGQPITASNGSGFVVSEKGYVLTNAHVVVNKPDSITMVQTADGKIYRATIEDIDMKTDLALLKIPCDNLPALKFGNSKDISPGEWVVALGSPLSLSHSITAGVISSINRDAEELGLFNNNMQYLQTDAAITFGHSGGPLVNLNGEVIGINNLRITAGIAFAIPINYVKEFLEHSTMKFPKKLEYKTKNFLGITALSLTADVLRQLMVEDAQVPAEVTNGVLIWKVIDQTPAAEGGLKSGDIITHVNGSPVQETADIYRILSESGNKNNFSVFRSQKLHNFKIYVNSPK